MLQYVPCSARDSRPATPAAVALLCLLLLSAAAPVHAGPCIERQQSDGNYQIHADCTWNSAAASGSVTVTGTIQANCNASLPGPPAVVVLHSPTEPSAAAASGPHSLKLTYVLLSGVRLPDPADPDRGLFPGGLLNPTAVRSGRASLLLQDVRVLVGEATLQQYIRLFSTWPFVATYTDGRSFLHINYVSSRGATWQSVGLLLANTTQQARHTANTHTGPTTASTSTTTTTTTTTSNSSSTDAAPAPVLGRSRPGGGVNYVLSANNATLGAQLLQLGVVAGPTPCLVYVDSNVTLSKPPVPAEGIPMQRPLVVVGMASKNTSIDFLMQVNQLLLNYTFSNITLDSLVTENLGPGDAKSTELAKPVSVSNGNNFWVFYWNRSEHRFTLRNVTQVLASQTELDYTLYWGTVFNSHLPYFKSLAAFMRDVIGMKKMELGEVTDTTAVVKEGQSRSGAVRDTKMVLEPVVATKMDFPVLRPELQLQQSTQSPLMVAVRTMDELQAQLQPGASSSSDASRLHIILLRHNITLQLSHTTNGSSTHTVSSSNNSSNSSSSSGSSGVSSGPAGMSVTQPAILLGEFSRARPAQTPAAPSEDAYTVLNFGFNRGVFDIKAQIIGGNGSSSSSSSGSSSSSSGSSVRSLLQLQHLWLRGLL